MLKERRNHEVDEAQLVENYFNIAKDLFGDNQSWKNILNCKLAECFSSLQTELSPKIKLLVLERLGMFIINNEHNHFAAHRKWVEYLGAFFERQEVHLNRDQEMQLLAVKKYYMAIILQEKDLELASLAKDSVMLQQHRAAFKFQISETTKYAQQAFDLHHALSTENLFDDVITETEQELNQIREDQGLGPIFGGLN